MNSIFDFSEEAMESLYEVVDDAYFRDRDAELIFEALKSRLKPIPFCNYLKKYIHQKAGLGGDFDDIPIKEYQEIICDSFFENNTPASFSSVTSKLSALSKNWLSQHTVKRSVVFLLGFGLDMSAEDINGFLTHALREPEINFKDPFEVICYYCRKKRFGYLKFESLWQTYLESKSNMNENSLLYTEATVGYRNSAESLCDDAALLSHLAKLKTDSNRSLLSVTAKRRFDELYSETKAIIADIYTALAEDEHMQIVEDYSSMLSLNDKLYDFQKLLRIEKKRSERRIFTAEDITPSIVEGVFCSAIPTDHHKNLIPMKDSKLGEIFYGKRFSRQHLSDILLGDCEIDRFDLITLNFFICSQKCGDEANPKTRYLEFVDSTNDILAECGMGELYVANPYECFVLMCILADDPLGTYADVWEMSYS